MHLLVLLTIEIPRTANACAPESHTCAYVAIVMLRVGNLERFIQNLFALKATAGGVVKHIAVSMSVSEFAVSVAIALDCGGCGGCSGCSDCDCGDGGWLWWYVVCVVGVYGAYVCGACMVVWGCSSKREQFETSLTRESLDRVLLLERVIRPAL